ncbi:MAG: site-2 protease family protein [Patescibacteria group bacterium]
MNDQRNQAAEKRPLVTGKELLLAALFFLVIAWLASWKFALIMMGSLLIHEFGHGWAMKRLGCGIRGFYFVPLLGLAVSPLRKWESRRDETIIALMGPAWGFALGLACLGLYFLTNEPIFAGAAMFNGFLNLFNLLPVNPVDGGRAAKSIAYSISPKFGLAVLVAGLGLTACLGLFFSPIVVAFIGLAGYFDLKQEISDQRQQRDRERIIAAFAEKLGVEPKVNVVSDALQQIFDCINAGLIDWSELHDEGLRQRMKNCGLTSGDMMKLFWTRIAVDATEPRRSFRSRATSAQELWALTDDDDFRQTPLGKFLKTKPLPVMTRDEALNGFVAYAALAGGLFWLFTAASQIMNFTELLKALS